MIIQSLFDDGFFQVVATLQLSTFSFSPAGRQGGISGRQEGRSVEWIDTDTPDNMTAMDDSDSLATTANTTAGDSSSDDTSIRVTSTKTSTPATSVLGEDKKVHSSRRPPSHRAASSKRDSLDSDSELSELEELGASRSRKKARLGASTEASAPSKTASPSNALSSNSTPSADATNSNSARRRTKRGNSPEVVVYVKSAGSSAASRRDMANQRARSSLATSSPINTENISLKKEESDGDETEDDLVFRKDASSLRKGRDTKIIADSEEEKDVFVPSDEDELADNAKEESIDEDYITASRLIAQQVAKSIGDKLASSSLMKNAKSKNKKQLVAGSRKKTVTVTKKTTISRRDLDKLKKEVVSGSSKKGKGKTMESSDEEGDDDFVVDSAEEDEDQDLPISEDSDGSSDLSDIDESGASRPTKIKSTSSAKATKRALAKAARDARKAGIKLTWWQKNEIALQQHHSELRDVWDNLKTVEVVKPIKADQPKGLTMQLLPFQLEGLHWLLQQEKGPWKGGLLADEMGMGKTIQMISLVLSDFDPTEKDRKHTLVLAPTVAIMQWRNEFNKFTSGMKVCVWHGGNRTNDKKELLKYDVILTSYAVLESSFRRQNQGFKRKGELIKEDSVLHSIPWHRVILDEAHNIKDRSCNTARGAFALKANYRWCLSGTPLQNRVGELYSLIRFIGVDPFAYYYCKKCPCKALHWRFSNKRTCDECGHTPMHHICYWNNEILKPIQKYGAMAGTHGAGAFEKLSLLLARMMLRRTKVERADDMGLPPRAIMVRRDYFTEEEEEFYTSLYSDVKRTFSTYVAADSLLNNYANVFQLLTRMRQTACHPDMVLKGAAAKALLGDNASKAALSISTCRLCLDEGDDPIMSKCRHVFCRECIRQYLETAIEIEPECPVCHLPMTIDLNQETEQELLDAKQGMLAKIDPGKWRTSTKIEALVEELSQLKTEDHSIKSLVFSQFTSFLDLIARRLQLAGFKIARLQGNMTPEARDRTIKYFMNTTDCTVFLLSLKAGGVALNLTEASRVSIMDPWWNPAAELQAMDRIHRLGQHRPVIVKRLIIENSIESKIVELQKKKENMTGAALGDDDQALGRLTPEDLSFLFVM